MAKIFLGIALAVMLATAALGFLAKGNADKLQTTLKAKSQELDTTKSSLSIAKGNEKKAQEELATANAKVEEQGKEIATQKGQMDDLNKKIADAAKDMEAKIAEVATLNTKIADLMKGTTPAVDGAEPPIVTQLKAEVAKAQTERDEAKQFADTLTAKKKEIEDQMASLKAYKANREIGYVRQGTTGRILAVNGGWNFVVLSIGDKQGSVVGATMLVLRGGEPIAKARVSSVEAATSIADILPGSVRRGVTVQPGDSIVFEGRAAGAAAGQPAGGAPPVLPVR